MSIEHIAFLQQLEREAQENHTQEFYLWPRTPISNIQAEMWRRVGVSDWRDDDPRSRPSHILATIEQLIYNRLVPEAFTCLDICCGDALILWHIKRRFPFSTTCGLDLNAGRLDTHPIVRDTGVRLFRSTIQRLFWKETGPRFDVAIMLNTYRGWQSADLNDKEKWLPAASRRWFKEHARYTILTVDTEQVDELKRLGFWVNEIGGGEDGSVMVLCWPCASGELEELWSQKRR